MLRSWGLSIALAFFPLAPAARAQSAAATPYKYFRVGNAKDASVKPHAGYALMGGGKDLDEAFQWLCGRAPGGDLLVLRAGGGDDYNPYIRKLCKLNSVATLILPTRAAAEDPFAAKTISSADVIFIAGGDQANYINFWMGTPVQTALNDAILRGIPIGGTSAGLAVLGEYAYSAQGDKPDDKDLDSRTALENPFHPRVTLVRGFLEIPTLEGIITDSHFAKRDRMGRLLAFLARLNSPDNKGQPASAPNIRGIGIEERAAVLLEPGGHATVVGYGCAYFVDPYDKPALLAPGKPLTMGEIGVQKVEPDETFNLDAWEGYATRYLLSADAGVLHSSAAGGAVY